MKLSSFLESIKNEKNKLLIKIGNRKIGPDYKPLIIVELGINHNGN